MLKEGFEFSVLVKSSGQSDSQPSQGSGGGQVNKQGTPAWDARHRTRKKKCSTPERTGTAEHSVKVRGPTRQRHPTPPLSVPSLALCPVEATRATPSWQWGPGDDTPYLPPLRMCLVQPNAPPVSASKTEETQHTTPHNDHPENVQTGRQGDR